MLNIVEALLAAPDCKRLAGTQDERGLSMVV